MKGKNIKMKTINIEKNRICYFPKNELPNSELGEFNDLYQKTYDNADKISKELNIECPDIGLINQIRAIHPTTKLVSVQGAQMFTPDDSADLDTNLIMMSYEDFDPLRFEGTLAHEMRHIWQRQYQPNLLNNKSIGFGESLSNPAEIDADAYAFNYLSKKHKISLEEAAAIICPEEKAHYKDAYYKRLNRAYDLQKNNFFKKIIAKIKYLRKGKKHE